MKCYVGSLNEARQGLVLAESAEEARGIVGWKAWRFKKHWYVIALCPILDPRPRTLYSRDWSEDRWEEEGHDKRLEEIGRLLEVARSVAAGARRA